jgi:hypothetical protein
MYLQSLHNIFQQNRRGVQKNNVNLQNAGVLTPAFTVLHFLQGSNKYENYSVEREPCK